MAVHPAAHMSDQDIVAEIATLDAVLDDMFGDPDDEGHSGSPGEWIIERLDELVHEQERRLAGQTKQKLVF